jgi:hypothetical protein
VTCQSNFGTPYWIRSSLLRQNRKSTTTTYQVIVGHAFNNVSIRHHMDHICSTTAMGETYAATGESMAAAKHQALEECKSA